MWNFQWNSYAFAKDTFFEIIEYYSVSMFDVVDGISSENLCWKNLKHWIQLLEKFLYFHENTFPGITDYHSNVVTSQ